MKSFAVSIVLLFLTSSVSAQYLKKVRVPQVREKNQIDSILSKSIQNSKTKGSCILIDIYKNKNNYDLGMDCIRTHFPIIDLGYDRKSINILTLAYKNNLRYFYHDHCLVFVKGEDFNNFFTLTGNSKIFTFLNRIRKVTINKNLEDFSKKTYSFDYRIFENNHFTYGPSVN